MKKRLWLVVLIFVFGFSTSCRDKAAMAELEKYKAQAKVEEQNKELARNFIAAIDRNDFGMIKELCSADFAISAPGLTEPLNVETLIQVIQAHYGGPFRDVRGGEYLGTRDLLVWLPPSYAAAEARYPVLYMQDGQNLFDPGTSYAGEWHVDESMEAPAEGLEAIVVGVPNARERRLDEYSPFRDASQGGGGAYAYLEFLTRVIRATVEAEFRVERGAAATGILGSSMGGMFALWGHLERPDVFGFAGAMSPSLGFASDGVLRYLRRALIDLPMKKNSPATRTAIAPYRTTAGMPPPSSSSSATVVVVVSATVVVVSPPAVDWLSIF